MRRRPAKGSQAETDIFAISAALIRLSTFQRAPMTRRIAEALADLRHLERVPVHVDRMLSPLALVMTRRVRLPGSEISAAFQRRPAVRDTKELHTVDRLASRGGSPTQAQR